MASLAQLTANRLNAQRSTGPRTEAGKAVSRFNALIYGVDAQSLVLPGEDPAALEALALEYHRSFNPSGPLEDYLVQNLVQADWSRRRYSRIEAQFVRGRLAAAPRKTAAERKRTPAKLATPSYPRPPLRPPKLASFPKMPRLVPQALPPAHAPGKNTIIPPGGSRADTRGRGARGTHCTVAR